MLRASRSARLGAAALALAAAPAIIAPAARAQGASASATADDPRWDAIRRVFGQGKTEEGYFRVELPRSDLRVRIAGDSLSPRFEFTSYAGFVPVGTKDVLAMGEVVLRADEVPAALAEAHRRGVHVSALHNHLIGETPRIMYLHVIMRGAADSVATALRSVFAKTATPLAAGKDESPSADWAAIDAILGKHEEAEGKVAEWVFPREERLRVHGVPVKSNGTIETASEVVFQQLGGGRTASTGELFVLPTEVDPVARALDEHGLHVTAVHNHMVEEEPRMYWIHWYAAGDGPQLARGVEAALSLMHGARKSEAKGQ
ncbi:MAG TPA: DUF1259 domain-containing protein [Gemmatimonadaceae bacterium]|nr:DUF1259 domain-containing protein [Gemmatimonadaceae bacterium]